MDDELNNILDHYHNGYYCNEKEIEQLTQLIQPTLLMQVSPFIDDKCHHYPINRLPKKYYNLLINNTFFEINNIDDMYYMAIYYECNRNYDIMKKYLLMAIDKGCVAAMKRMAHYYMYTENNSEMANKYYFMIIINKNSDELNNLGHRFKIKKDYDRMRIYYLLAIEHGNTDAMINLSNYYKRRKDYDQMKKYLLMAIDKGCTSAMNILGMYYFENENNYCAAEKYFLMEIEKGTLWDLTHLGRCQDKQKKYDLAKKCYLLAIEYGNMVADLDFCRYFRENLITNNDLQNYFFAVTKGKFGLRRCWLFNNTEPFTALESREIDLFCENINADYLNFGDFDFCVHKIINRINKINNYGDNLNCKSENINKFIKYISKLYYFNGKVKKYDGRDNIHIILKNNMNVSQLFMEYLDIYYYKHLGKKLIPGGKEYIKIKEHFELMARKMNRNKLEN
jgi:predicted transcriptional regulator